MLRPVFFLPVGTLYDELGARPGASTEELRQAYRRRARDLHPDLRPGDEAVAAEAMARLNSAWKVLGDPAERRRYDLELALAGSKERAARMVADGTVRAGSDGGNGLGVAPGPHPTVGFRPRMWFLVLGVLAVIFVVTAYAATGPSSAPEAGVPGECLSVMGAERYVPCSEPNIGTLVRH